MVTLTKYSNYLIHDQRLLLFKATTRMKNDDSFFDCEKGLGGPCFYARNAVQQQVNLQDVLQINRVNLHY